MRVIAAGLGEPVDPATFILNQSRLMTFLECSEKWRYKYELNREKPDQYPVALRSGTAWHLFLETLAEVGHQRFGKAIKVAQRYLDDAAENVSGKHADDLMKFKSWIAKAGEVYADKFKDNSPHGKVIATEKPFWITLDVYGTAEVTMLGRIDRVLKHKGKVWNGEIKTMAPTTDIPAFIDYRSNHIQDALYFLGLQHTYGNTAGTIYDLAAKHPVPARASGGLTKEERLEQWPSLLFHHQEVLWTEERALGVLGRALVYFLDSPGRHNLNSCMQFGKPSCEFFDTCHRGVEISSGIYADREPDYVDEAEESPL